MRVGTASPMKRISRRDLLKTVPLGGLALLLDGPGALRCARQVIATATPPQTDTESIDPIADEGAHHRSEHDPLNKTRDFDRTYADDYLLAESRLELLAATADKLERAVRVIGPWAFQPRLLRRPAALRPPLRRDRRLLAEPRLQFLDEIFYTDAELYGFHGQQGPGRADLPGSTSAMSSGSPRPVTTCCGENRSRGTRGSARTWGRNVFLTSGVRGVVKQYQLFLSKAVTTGGNLSQASRSLAPPGYSYHAIGDFDVGRVGFGSEELHRRLRRDGGVPQAHRPRLRGHPLHRDQPLWRAPEPWHIKIA